MTTIAVSEYIRFPTIRQWVKGDYIVLGTDGFGRSDTRDKLRDHFEINANHIALNAVLFEYEKEAREFIKSNKIKLMRLRRGKVDIIGLKILISVMQSPQK